MNVGCRTCGTTTVVAGCLQPKGASAALLEEGKNYTGYEPFGPLLFFERRKRCVAFRWINAFCSPYLAETFVVYESNLIGQAKSGPQ